LLSDLKTVQAYGFNYMQLALLETIFNEFR